MVLRVPTERTLTYDLRSGARAMLAASRPPLHLPELALTFRGCRALSKHLSADFVSCLTPEGDVSRLGWKQYES